MMEAEEERERKGWKKRDSGDGKIKVERYLPAQVVQIKRKERERGLRFG